MRTMPANIDGPMDWPVPQDVNEEVDYTLNYRAATHATSTAYRIGHRVLPATANGCSYRCTSAGVSGATAPTWSTLEGEEVEDGGVTWVVERDNFLLPAGESISSSTWAASDGVTIGTSASTGTTATAWVTAFPSPAPTSFTITNTIVTSGGRTYRRSLRIRVAEK